jgi:hypothetical protein
LRARVARRTLSHSLSGPNGDTRCYGEVRSEPLRPRYNARKLKLQLRPDTRHCAHSPPITPWCLALPCEVPICLPQTRFFQVFSSDVFERRGVHTAVRTHWCAKVEKSSVHINPREDALTQRSVECSKRFSGGMVQHLLSMKAVSSFIARCIFHWVSVTRLFGNAGLVLPDGYKWRGCT